MVRKITIALAAVALVMAGSTWKASAMHGGGFGGGHSGGFGRSAMAGPTVFHGNQIAGNRFAFREGDRGWFGHHRFFRNRFAFFGLGFPYGYYNSYDDCYTRVWTRWGWRWQYVCY